MNSAVIETSYCLLGGSSITTFEVDKKWFY